MPSGVWDRAPLELNAGVNAPLFRTPSILPLKGPKLEDLKLANILSAQTCSPISFHNFSTFVTEKELTTENLLFVIWYRSYQDRWQGLSQQVKANVPVPSTRLVDRYVPFGPTDPSAPEVPLGNQPMREEATRAFATFLSPGGSRSLGISDELRQFTRTCLAKSSAPECFQPVYEEVYHALETQTLPHFLSYASTNVNKPKQMFWYYVGAIDFFIGLAIYLILTLLLSSHHFGYRAIRLPSTIFASFGCMQMYSAYRGFCSQVWKRSSRQVRPWELDEVDEEASVQSKDEGEGWNMTGVERVTSPTTLFNDNIFTGPNAPPDLYLSPEVHPLTDLSDIASSPMTPTSTTGLTSAVYTVSGEDEEQIMEEKADAFSEEGSQRLAMRRATLKVPDAALAFPISEDDLSPRKSSRQSTGGSMRPSISSLGSTLRQSLGSPMLSPINDTSIRSTTTPLGAATPVEADMPQNIARSTDHLPDLGRLLDRFRTSSTGRLNAKQKSKTFGPEELVEDPRVKALFESVVRDVLVVGGISGVIWIALCLAVPCAGLV